MLAETSDKKQFFSIFQVKQITYHSVLLTINRHGSFFETNIVWEVLSISFITKKSSSDWAVVAELQLINLINSDEGFFRIANLSNKLK